MLPLNSTLFGIIDPNLTLSHRMTPLTSHHRPYEQPSFEVLEIIPHGVLCQSGGTPDMDSQNMENPSAPVATDYAW